MKRRYPLAIAAVFSLLAAGALYGWAQQAVPATATPGSQQQDVTVGFFAIRLATALDLPVPQAGFDEESASWALWKAGVRVSPQVHKTLTERDVVDALSQLGFALTTTRPDVSVNARRAEAIVNTFVGASAAAEKARQSATVQAAGNGGDDFNNGNGKGGKFKRKSKRSDSGTDG